MLNLIEKWKEAKEQCENGINLSIRIAFTKENDILIQKIQKIMDRKEWNWNKTCLRLLEMGVSHFSTQSRGTE